MPQYLTVKFLDCDSLTCKECAVPIKIVLKIVNKLQVKIEILHFTQKFKASVIQWKILAHSFVALVCLGCRLQNSYVSFSKECHTASLKISFWGCSIEQPLAKYRLTGNLLGLFIYYLHCVFFFQISGMKMLCALANYTTIQSAKLAKSLQRFTPASINGFWNNSYLPTTAICLQSLKWW